MADRKSKFEIEFLLKAGNAQAQLKKIDNTIEKTGKTAKKTSKQTNFLSNTVKELGEKTKVLSTIGLIGLIAGLVNAAKALFGFNKELTKTQKLVADLTNKSGKDLVNFTAKIQATADTFEQDFNEILSSANTVAKEFSISQEEALNKINKGFIEGSNSSGQFLDILKEYPTQLRAVGLGADETFAIINQQVKEGIYSDKGVDAIKEAGLRLREMPEATKKAIDGIGLSSKEIQKGLENGTLSIFDVIQKVSGKLDTLPPQSAQVGAAIADIFGGAGEDAGLRYLKTLKNINIEQKGVNTQLTEQQKLQEQQLDNQERINKIMAEFFGETGSGFDKMIADLLTITLDLFDGMIRKTQDFIKWFEDLQDESKGFRFTVQLVASAFTLLWEQAKSALSLIGAGFKSLGDVIEGVFKLDTDKIREGFVSFGLAVKQEMSNTFKAINEEQKKLQEEFDAENETRIAERAEQRKQAAIEATKAEEKAIQEIKLKSLDETNKRILLATKKLNDERFKEVSLRLNQETVKEKESSKEIDSINAANALANVNYEKNAGHQILNIFKGQAIGALIKSILSSIPFPANVVVAGGAGAMANSLFDSIPKFERGLEEGFIGGSSLTGDNILARVNSREGVITTGQQKILADIATGKTATIDASKNNMKMLDKMDELIAEIQFSEKNFHITNILDVTPTDLLEVTEKGERDRNMRASVG